MERLAIWVGEGSDRSAEEFLEEVIEVVGTGKSFKFEKTTAADLRVNDCYSEEDYTDSEIEECSDMYITVVYDE